MAITVDTVQLRFKIKPDYNQQQIQQLQSDLKQSQKNIEAERKEMDKYSRTLNETRVKLREAIEKAGYEIIWVKYDKDLNNLIEVSAGKIIILLISITPIILIPTTIIRAVRIAIIFV